MSDSEDSTSEVSVLPQRAPAPAPLIPTHTHPCLLPVLLALLGNMAAALCLHHTLYTHARTQNEGRRKRVRLTEPGDEAGSAGGGKAGADDGDDGMEDFDEDSEDESDSDDSDDVRASASRRRSNNKKKRQRKKKVNDFILDEAEVDDDVEDDEEWEEGAEDIIDQSKGVHADRGRELDSHRRLQKMFNDQKEDEIEQYYRNKYAEQQSERYYDGDGDLPDDIAQQALQPGMSC